jgi:hypothetical protein
MADWTHVKKRTAAGGGVWRSEDGQYFKRTGDVLGEAGFQAQIFDLGYPVPQIVEFGSAGDEGFFIERSLGGRSLHDQALADAQASGTVSQATVADIAGVSRRLLAAQAANPIEAAEWFGAAAFADNVYTENPDFDAPRVHAIVTRALNRLAELPMTRGHLDFGLPNTFPAGVIDWQFHGPVPLGYDVYPALEIVAFKGGNKGYAFTADQRAQYLAALDDIAAAATGRRLSGFLGEFLLVKCFFFLALMRPTDPTRHDKWIKWQYRRHLFETGLTSYDANRTIDTSAFPTYSDFAEQYQDR